MQEKPAYILNRYEHKSELNENGDARTKARRERRGVVFSKSLSLLETSIWSVVFVYLCVIQNDSVCGNRGRGKAIEREQAKNNWSEQDPREKDQSIPKKNLDEKR